jgi:hypothetical protein
MLEREKLEMEKVKNYSSQQVSLAKCILDVFEKAINVQYAEYIGSIAKPKENAFFFLSDQDLRQSDAVPR